MLLRNRERADAQARRTARTEERRKKLDAAVSHLCSLHQDEASAMRDVNLFRWICSMMKITGSFLSQNRIGAMLDGETVNEATVEEYRYLRACMALYREFRHMADFNNYLDEKYIVRIHKILSGSDSSDYRRGDTKVNQMEYQPPRSAEIGRLMKVVDREIASEEHYEDRVAGAVRTHDMIMAVWPFEEGNAETAYAAMSYELFWAGYPLPALDITDIQHFELSSDFVQKGNSSRLYSVVVDNLLEQCGGIKTGL